ncbi:hypothetical protein KIW84_035185 [Lathyrus oleraceus]|uniref:Uncharacterized protein n=1 Tax=Pisum sativum TaxID=3888 RepID=A0A9D5B0F4_PEA|nr:hypothetical protein KIW84_035185 [Pisum sativum]
MNSKAHREALQGVLEQAYLEQDVTVDQFDHIVANITSCNNLSFYDEELPEEGRKHNLALYISMNCKEDALSNVLVDTGSSLNVLPKSTFSKLSYQGAPMRYSGVIVKAFDGSRKTLFIGKCRITRKTGGKTKQQSRHRALFIPKEGKETLEVNLEKTWSRGQREWDRESVMRREGISTPTHPSYSTGSTHRRKDKGC